MLLYDMLLYDMLLYDMLLYDMLLYDMLLYHMLRYDMLLYDMLLYDMLLYDMLLYDMLLYNMLLYNMLLYYMLLYDKLLYYMLLYDMLLYDMLLYNMLLYDMLLYDMLLYDMLLYDMLLHDMLLYNMLLYDMLLYDMLLYDMLLYDMLLYDMLLYDMLLYNMLLYDMLLYDMLLYDMLLYDIPSILESTAEKTQVYVTEKMTSVAKVMLVLLLVLPSVITPQGQGCKQQNGEAGQPCKRKNCKPSQNCNPAKKISEVDQLAESGDFDAAAKELDNMTQSGMDFTRQNLKDLGNTLQGIRKASKKQGASYGKRMSTSIFGSLEMLKNNNPSADVFEEQEKSQIIEMIEEISAELEEGSNLEKPSILAQSIRYEDKDEMELTLPDTIPGSDRPIKLNFGTYRGRRTNIAVLDNSYKDILPAPSGGSSTLESPIISVTFVDNEGVTKSATSNKSFSLVFQLKEHPEYRTGYNIERKCVYLNTTTNTWLNNGCTTLLNLDRTCTCTCSHTTSFAVLLSPTPVADEAGQEVVSYVMFGINVTFLFLTFSLIAPFGKLRKNKMVMTQLGLVLTLMLGNIIFVVLSATSSIAVNDTGAPLLSLNVSCVTGVIISQYFFLSAFFWMGCIAWTFFNKIVRAVKTFGKTDKHYFRNCALLSWICPIIFPVTSFLFSLIPNKSSEYTMPYVGGNRENGSHCWVEDPWRYIGFLVPAYLILLFNCVCFGMVAKVILNSTGKPGGSEAVSVKTAKAMMVVAVSVGLPWIVAGLAVGPAASFMQYLFIIFIGLQGPLLFVSLVLLQGETRKNTRRILGWYLGRSQVAALDTAQSTISDATH
ncbi:hypothetical protein ACHWQZ_G000762 [Mnemiopsis leidyi]